MTDPAPLQTEPTEHILVVDDEEDILDLIAYHLRGAGFSVATAGTAAAAFAAVARRRPDLILLDIMLPDLSGLEVCRRLTRQHETESIPIVIVSARTEEIDRVVGFELGATDYIGKPFSVRELVLRVRAVLRRSVGSPTSPGEQLRLRGLVMDLVRHSVSLDGEELQLTPLEFELLAELLAQRGRVLSRETLLERVWGRERWQETRTVDTHVTRLREKLGPARDLIATVRGIGYRVDLD